MATVTWLIKKNSDAPATLASLGVTSCVPGLKANGVDSITFVQSNDWLAAPLWTYGTKIALIQRTVDGGVTTDVCRFVGTVEGIPRAAQGAGEHALSYTAFNAAYDLQRCDYEQEWTYTKEDGTTAQIYEPTVVIGEDNNGVRLTSGQVIGHVAAYAISRGVQIDLGTINPGVAIPLDERDNIKCWNAIVSVLSYTPDYVLWFDYNHQVDGVYVPALNLTAPDDMTVVSKAQFVPRNDIRTPGVQIIYRWTGEYDGRTVKSRVIEQAGDCESYKRVSLVFDLEGSRSVFISQDVEVEDYPADWTSAAGKATLIKLVPSLSSIPDADWSVVSCTRTGSVNAYPARLISGAVPEWTDKGTESDLFTVRISYYAYSTDTSNLLERGEKIFNFRTVSTDAVTKTYRKMTEWVEAEPVPAGLAAALLASWNRLHFDGSVTFHDDECPFDLIPGMRLSCTGGLLEWETMNAVVQDVTMDLAKGTTSVRVGTCGRLQADNLLAVYRAARGRRFSTRRIGRDSGDASNGNQISGPDKTPNDNGSDGTPPCMLKYLAVENKNATDILHRVEIDPGNLQTALSVQENVAQTFKLRPLELMFNDGPDADGNARVAVYKTYALMAEPAFDRHDTLSDIPEGSSGPVTSANLAVQNPLTWDATTPELLILKIAAQSGLTVLYSGETLLGLAVDARAHSGLKIDTSSPSLGLQLEGLTPGTAPTAAFVWGYNGTSYGKFLLTTVSLT